MKILLVESRFNRLKVQRSNLALARFSTLLKKDNTVAHYILDSKKKPVPFIPDKIIASLIFSWDVPKVCDFIKDIKKKNPSLIVEVGGVAAPAMAGYIRQRLGNIPLTGQSDALDLIIPDDSFIPEDATYVFTSRGCPNACSFCIVNKLEGPVTRVVPNWRDQIALTKKDFVITDNNILATPEEHQDEVFEFLNQHCSNRAKVLNSRKIRTCQFDGGFDFRRITSENLARMKDINFSKIRLAFDNIAYENKFDEAMQLVLKTFPAVSKRGMHEKIAVFVLYNYHDTLEDTLYRLYKLHRHYKVFPYLMRYQPLETLSYKTFLDPNWDQHTAVDVGRWANARQTLWSCPDFKYYGGRQSDGQSISIFTGVSELEGIEQSISKLDFSKGFKFNLKTIQEDLKKRQEILQQFKHIA